MDAVTRQIQFPNLDPLLDMVMKTSMADYSSALRGWILRGTLEGLDQSADPNLRPIGRNLAELEPGWRERNGEDYATRLREALLERWEAMNAQAIRDAESRSIGKGRTEHICPPGPSLRSALTLRTRRVRALLTGRIARVRRKRGLRAAFRAALVGLAMGLMLALGVGVLAFVKRDAQVTVTYNIGEILLGLLGGGGVALAGWAYWSRSAASREIGPGPDGKTRSKREG